jgi:ABC-type uncharacterized transport system substrate-binding protein
MKRWEPRSHIWPILLVAVLSGAEEQGHADNHETTAIASIDAVLATDRRAIQSISYGWRFDQNFSADMLESFDDDGDARLDAAELREASQSVYDTIKAYRYFLLLTRDGNPVDVRPPAQMAATYQDSRLSVAFEARLVDPLPLTARIEIGLFDPTFSIDFDDASTIEADDLPANCTGETVRPDFDAVVAANPQALNDDPAEDPDGGRTIALFASRLVVTCRPS